MMTLLVSLRVSSKRVRVEPGGEATLRIRQRHASAWWTAVVQRFFGSDHSDDRRVWASHDVPIHLTDDEAAELADEMFELMKHWMKRGHGAAGKQDADRRTYLARALVFPRTEQTAGRAE